MMPREKPLVLLVEDNEADRFLARKAFLNSGHDVELAEVVDGRDCMKYLKRQAPYLEARRPDLILLDLNLPRMDGRRVMAEILGDPALRTLPVIVLSTSSTEHERREMYDMRCSSYITKPLDFDTFELMVRRICDYWFSVVDLPAVADV